MPIVKGKKPATPKVATPNATGGGQPANQTPPAPLTGPNQTTPTAPGAGAAAPQAAPSQATPQTANAGGSTAPGQSTASVSSAGYQYHDALEAFPVGNRAQTLLQQNANAMSCTTMLDTLVREAGLINEKPEPNTVVVASAPEPVSAAAFMIGSVVDLGVDVQVPPTAGMGVGIPEGLDVLASVLDRAKPIFSDAVDELALEITLNPIKEGDI